MKRKQRNLMIVVFALVVLSNIFSVIINASTQGLTPTFLYQTKNAEFEFTTMLAKGRTIKMMELNYDDFKKTNSGFEEQQLYRTFKRNPLQFWNWYSYMTNEMYSYDYHKQSGA